MIGLLAQMAGGYSLIQIAIFVIVLLDVFPVDAVNYVANGSSRNAKRGCEFALRKVPSGVPLANRDDILLCQSSKGMRDASVLATLGNLVGNIVGVSSDKQMVRVDTQRRVAFVAYDQPGLNRPMLAFVGEAMGKYLLSTIKAHEPVALTCGASPQNATSVIRDAGIHRESLFGRNLARQVSAVVRAKLNRGGVASPIPREVFAATGFAQLRSCDTVSARHVGPPNRFGVFRAGPQLELLTRSLHCMA